MPNNLVVGAEARLLPSLDCKLSHINEFQTTRNSQRTRENSQLRPVLQAVYIVVRPDKRLIIGEQLVVIPLLPNPQEFG